MARPMKGQMNPQTAAAPRHTDTALLFFKENCLAKLCVLRGLFCFKISFYLVFGTVKQTLSLHNFGLNSPNSTIQRVTGTCDYKPLS
jgi:hypothetical protein